MKLYTRWQNSAGERVRIVLNLKTLPYEYVSVETLPAGRYDDPQVLMPTLEVEGRFISQSAAILQYLEKVYPEPSLLPDEAIIRAQARAFGAVVASEMHAVTVNRLRKYLGVLNVGERGVNRWVHRWLVDGFESLETMLMRRPIQWKFCFGDVPGWADLHLVPQLANGWRLGVDLLPYPTLLAVEAECAGLDAFRKARPEAQADYPG